MIVCPLHWYYSADHLAEVQAEMVRRGPPRLRGYLDEVSGAFLLREGTHRVRAAQRLGLVPVLVPIPWWRARARLDRARVAATTRGLRFPEVSISHMDESKQVCYKDPMPLRYVVCPGPVISRTDAQEHEISGAQLIRLYAVNARECLVLPRDSEKARQVLQGRNLAGLTFLRPRFDGDYSRTRETT